MKGNGYVAPTLFHLRTMEVESVEQDMKEAGFKDIHGTTFSCYHPDHDVDAALEMFYTMDNPSTRLFMKGFSPAEIKQTRPFFKDPYSKMYDGGKTRQFEVAISATARESSKPDLRTAVSGRVVQTHEQISQLL